MSAPRVGACKSCGAPIFFGTMASGQTMPFNAAPDPAGAWYIQRWMMSTVPVMGYLPIEATLSPAPDRYVSHFASCVNADAHRRKRINSRAPTTVPAK